MTTPETMPLGEQVARTVVALAIWVVLIALAWGLVRAGDVPEDDARQDERP